MDKTALFIHFCSSSIPHGHIPYDTGHTSCHYNSRRRSLQCESTTSEMEVRAAPLDKMGIICLVIYQPWPVHRLFFLFILPFFELFFFIIVIHNFKNR